MLTFTTRLPCIRRAKFFSTAVDLRKARLREIYEPHIKGLVKGSKEYLSLAESGQIWENHFRPANPEPYFRAQAKLKHALESADEQKRWFKENRNVFAKIVHTLVSKYSQQSTSIELNPLPLSDALIIEEHLEEQLFSNLPGLSNMSTGEIVALELPDNLLPGKDPASTNELRNHIVISRYVTEVALANTGKNGFVVSEIKELSRAILRDTNAVKLYRFGWGGRIELGDFRNVPIQVKSNPMAIFPYHYEVPALIERYVQWRDRQDHTLHPLILAVQIYMYFVHIHPFKDGNGRLGRVLMSDYLIRQGYFPVVLRNLVRVDYLRKISDATEDGSPEELCSEMIQTQLEMMREVRMESEMGGMP